MNESVKSWAVASHDAGALKISFQNGQRVIREGEVHGDCNSEAAVRHSFANRLCQL